MAACGRRIFQLYLGFCLFLISSASFSATKPRSPKSCDEILQARPPPLPKVDPVILKRLNRLLSGPNYLFEMKYDGFRGVAYFEPGRCLFISRNGKHLSQFQDLCEAIAKELKVKNAIFDGEIIAPDPTGRPVFNRMLRREGPFAYVAFDLLWLNGEDLRSLPLKDRRKKLLKVLPESSPLISEPVVDVGSGVKLYDLMIEHDLEGIVVKRLSDKYSRSTKWYKFKNKNYSQAIGRKHFRSR